MISDLTKTVVFVVKIPTNFCTGTYPCKSLEGLWFLSRVASYRVC
jgi:hypothetical protein